MNPMVTITDIEEALEASRFPLKVLAAEVGALEDILDYMNSNNLAEISMVKAQEFQDAAQQKLGA